MAQMNLTKDWGFDFNANVYFAMEYGLKNIRWNFRLAQNFPIVDLSYVKANGVRVDNLGLFCKQNATESDVKFLEGKTITDCVLRWGCYEQEAVDEKTGEITKQRVWADKPTVVAMVIDGEEYKLHGHTRGFNEAAVIEKDAE